MPLVDIPVEYGSLTAPLPPDTSGTVYIRLVDTDRTPGNYPMDGVSVDFMSIDTFVPLSMPLFADSFESGDSFLWTVTVP